MRAKLFATAAIVGAAMPANAAFVVTYENPGVEHSTAIFSVVGTASFDSRPVGNDETFTTSFNTGTLFTGVYTGINIIPANEYGGAGGTGRYPVAGYVGGATDSYSVQLSTTAPTGINYFGYWLSALDAGNQVTFYKGGQQVFTYTPQNVLQAIGGNKAYYGNPNPAFQGQDGGEPFAFLNFYDVGDTFDRVVFTQNGGGGYESDNHTVGYYTQRAGNVLPEPGVWAMLLTGFGLTGWAARRRRGPVARVYA